MAVFISTFKSPPPPVLFLQQDVQDWWFQLVEGGWGAGGLGASGVAPHKWRLPCNWVWSHRVLGGNSARRVTEALGSKSGPWGRAGSLLCDTKLVTEPL